MAGDIRLTVLYVPSESDRWMHHPMAFINHAVAGARLGELGPVPRIQCLRKLSHLGEIDMQVFELFYQSGL